MLLSIFEPKHEFPIPFCTFSGRNSDVNLVELGNETIKEDDRAVLLEGGGLQSASPRSRSLSSKSHIVRYVENAIFFRFVSNRNLLVNLTCEFFLSNFRFFMMEESFLLENRLTLRAMYVGVLKVDIYPNYLSFLQICE